MPAVDHATARHGFHAYGPGYSRLDRRPAGV